MTSKKTNEAAALAGTLASAPALENDTPFGAMLGLCADESIVDKVGEALNAQRFQMLADIAEELAGDVVFPTCFDTAVHLRAELQNPDVSVARIAQMVSLEPLVAAKLLHIANSAFFNPSGVPVCTLPEAIVRLGVNLVRTTALAVAMNQMLRAREMAVFEELTVNIWDHSIRTAVAARVLAHAQTRLNPDEAMLAGLVHDQGAFYMLYRATQYEELRARPESMKYLIAQWHESIGVALLNALGLPDEIVAATVDHDRPRQMPQHVQTLADVVYVGNLLAGANFEWLYQELAPDPAAVDAARAGFADLMSQIDTEAGNMLAVFG